MRVRGSLQYNTTYCRVIAPPRLLALLYMVQALRKSIAAPLQPQTCLTRARTYRSRDSSPIPHPLRLELYVISAPKSWTASSRASRNSTPPPLPSSFAAGDASLLTIKPRRALLTPHDHALDRLLGCQEALVATLRPTVLPYTSRTWHHGGERTDITAHGSP